MNQIGVPHWKRVYEKTVETKYAETRWPVYETYKLSGTKGFRYVWAYRATDNYSIDPFAPEYADLFLTFARWFDTQGMEKVQAGAHGMPTLDTERNAEAALSWVHQYGVLGLGRNPNEQFAVGGGLISSSAEISAYMLGKPELAHHGTRAYAKGRRGGPHETVEMFVSEAHEANVVLKLYEAATASTVDPSAIARFMSNRRGDAAYVPEKDRETIKSERGFWSQEAELAQHWALAVVEETVTRKVENDVYPILIGQPGSYPDAWGFKSLLGAMWLQMRGFMRGEINHCLECGDNLLHKSRRHQVYCNDTCGSRYRERRARKRKEQREQEAAREATRRKLRR